VGAHVHRPLLVDEVLGVIGLVGAKRDRPELAGALLIMAKAAKRSAWPSPLDRQASAIRPKRLPIGAWPMTRTCLHGIEKSSRYFYHASKDAEQVRPLAPILLNRSRPFSSQSRAV
jgi:hypothetical protein